MCQRYAQNYIIMCRSRWFYKKLFITCICKHVLFYYSAKPTLYFKKNICCIYWNHDHCIFPDSEYFISLQVFSNNYTDSHLFFVVDVWIIIWFVGCCRLYFLFFSISQKFKLVLYLPICTAYVNHFVASVCPLHFSFLEGC